ncbi:MAG: recombinase family protein [Firmicutes bacterium]|nr:recombinase family protein [Bacillota bacterium]
MKVAIYCRVSTEDQAESKTIQNQVEFAKKYCDLHQLTIYKFYLDDGLSGTIPLEERPAGGQLLKDAESGCFGTLYVYRLDRLARTTLDILSTHQRLSRLDVGLKSMTESFDTSTPSGKFFMTTLGGIAEIERSTIAERMRLGKVRALAEGRWPGGPPPYGYKVIDKKLVINENEAKIIKLIFHLYTVEGMDTVSVADYLTAAGYPSPAASRNIEKTANVWYGSKVWGVLTNPVYRGEYIYGKNKTSDKQQKFSCPVIINVRSWKKAEQKLKSNHFNAKRNAKYDYLLRGLVSCGACGRNYCGDGSHSKGRYHYYRCTGTSSFRGKLVEKCSSKYVRADILETLVWQDVINYIIKSDDVLQQLQHKMMTKKGFKPQTKEISLLLKVITQKDKERGRILALYRKGIIGELEAENQLTIIEKELSMLQQRKSRLESLRRDSGQELQSDLSKESLTSQLQEKFFEASAALKRELMATMVNNIVVNTIKEDGEMVPQVVINYCFSE